jgi:hypothetical protein
MASESRASLPRNRVTLDRHHASAVPLAETGNRIGNGNGRDETCRAKLFRRVKAFARGI